MRVRMRTTAAGPWGVLSAGRIGEVPDAIGRAMVSAGSAIEDRSEVVSVPEAPPPVVAATAEPAEATIVDPPRRRRKHATMQESGVPARVAG